MQLILLVVIMAIVGYSGLPGSGKSYGVVQNVILPALESGRHVITNIPLKIGRLSDDYPKGKVTIFDNKTAECDEDFFNANNWPPGVIWVIDEAWRFWKSGMKATHIPQSQKEFFTEHRHFVGEDGRTNEIVLVTQDLGQMCAFVRDLVEETYRAVKLSAVGQKNRFRVDVYTGAATGQKPGKPMRELYGKYKPEVYQYYKSHTRNKTEFAAGMEEKADKRANVLRSPLIWAGIPGAALMAVFSIWSLYQWFNPEPVQSQPITRGKQVTMQASHQPGQSVGTLKPIPYPEQSSESKQAKRAKEAQLAYDLDRHHLPLSEEWRIRGQFNGTYLLYSEKRGLRQVNKRLCSQFRSSGDPYCVIRGELVTWYSSKSPQYQKQAKGPDLSL